MAKQDRGKDPAQPQGQRQTKPKTKEEQQAEAIKKAQKIEWPGMEDFEPHEIAWLAKYSSAAGGYEASPYPLVGGRLRLLREDHLEPGEKYYIGPPKEGNGCGAAGISETTVSIFGRDGKKMEVPGYRVVRVVETSHGTFWGVKDGGKDSIEKLETMAVARALRFAGYGFGFTSAEEMAEFVQQEEVAKAPEKPKEQPQPEQKPQTIGQLKGEYFDFLKQNEVFKDDEDGKKRHSWQQLATGKVSSTMWDKADFQKAIMLIKWRHAVGEEADGLLDYLGNIKSVKGMGKAFLSVMEAEKVTDIADVSQWRVAMSAAKLSLDHKTGAAIDMGKALLRASSHTGIFEQFLINQQHEKLVELTAEEIKNWPDTLRNAIGQWMEQNKTEVDIDLIIAGPEALLFT
jgi:hypothetical protein